MKITVELVGKIRTIKFEALDNKIYAKGIIDVYLDDKLLSEINYYREVERV